MSIERHWIYLILVITKTYRKKHADRFIDSINEMYPNLNVKNIVTVLAQDEDPRDVDEGESPKKAFGLDTLIEVTAQIIPESAQKTWCNAQKASIELKAKKAQELVATTSTAAFGEGFIPVPFSDAFALVPTQLGMLAGITVIFGIDVS